VHTIKLKVQDDVYEHIMFFLKNLNSEQLQIIEDTKIKKDDKDDIRIFSDHTANPKEREKYDDYEMKDEYDFTGGVRGRFYKPKKIPTTLRLDDDIILYFKKKASEQKVPYQTLINTFLRKELQGMDGNQ